MVQGVGGASEVEVVEVEVVGEMVEVEVVGGMVEVEVVGVMVEVEVVGVMVGIEVDQLVDRGPIPAALMADTWKS